jgi:hypothetical protein
VRAAAGDPALRALPRRPLLPDGDADLERHESPPGDTADDEDDSPLEEDDSPEECDQLSGDYAIDLRRWFEYGAASYKAILGPTVGFLLLYALLEIGASTVPGGGLVCGLLLGPALLAGLTVVALTQLKGRRWTFGDFFAGFASWGNLVGLELLILLVLAAGAAPVGALVGIATAAHDTQLLGLALLLGATLLAAAVYFGVRGTFFATQLIVERHMGCLQALQGCWALTRGHFWSLLGISLLLGLINLGGFLLCYVGFLFTFPLTALVLNAGYLIAAGREPRRPDQARFRLPGSVSLSRRRS